MRRTVLAVFVMVLVCSFSAAAQRVDEGESLIRFGQTAADLSLTIDSRSKMSRQVTLEILDPAGEVKASTTSTIVLAQGRHPYKFAIPTTNFPGYDRSDLAWHRLRYQVGDASGMMSFSQIMRDDFELRAYVALRPFPGEDFTIRVRALSPIEKHAVRNVDLTCSIDLLTTGDKTFKLSARGRTNGDGIATVTIRIPANIQIDTFENFEITGRKGGVERSIDTDMTYEDYTQPKPSVFLTTDKPLYQPGQSFRVRALFLDATNVAVADKELKFSIEDEEDTTLYRQTVKTSAFGIASIEWPIPDDAKLGSYRVSIDADEDLETDQLQFKVSRYDLPNFAVAAKPDKTYYLPGDNEAIIEISADYLFGKPVGSGSVRVVQEAERKWNWEKQKYDIDEESSVEGVADADGKFNAKFDLTSEQKELQDKEWNRYTDLHFAAYFTDSLTNRNGAETL